MCRQSRSLSIHAKVIQWSVLGSVLNLSLKLLVVLVATSRFKVDQKTVFIVESAELVLFL